MRDRLRSQECAQRLKALADADRLRIIQCLLDGPRNVSEVAHLLGLELANASHHLGVLRHAGLVQVARHGKFMIYSLHPAIVRPRQAEASEECLDFGCCRLELPIRRSTDGTKVK